MFMSILVGYLVVSLLASLIFYAACVAAARADKIQRHSRAAHGSQKFGEGNSAQRAAGHRLLTA
jgi:hypothetical protein